MTDEAMHVGIQDSKKWKKEILKLGINTIQILKSVELHKKFIKEKDVHRKKFIQLIEELSQDIQEFKKMLPSVKPNITKPKKEAKPEKEEIEQKAEIMIIKKPKKRTKKKTEVEKLENDIASLRDKIAKI